MTYRHIFACPNCNGVACFDDSDKIDKDATLITGCADCGHPTTHKYVESRVL